MSFKRSNTLSNQYKQFNILDVALRCGVRNFPGLNTPFKDLPDGQKLAICPIPGCEDKSGHLYLKPETNEYICFRCGNGGYALGLYALCHGIDTKEAYKRLCNDEEIAYHPTSKPPKPASSPKPIADIQQRHVVYSSLLQQLPLANEYLVDLLKRGLTEKTIQRNMYRSMPGKKQVWAICDRLANKYELEGIPGFYVNRAGKWDMLSRPGLLIPSRDINSLIQGIRIRRPKWMDTLPKEDPRWQGKVIWFSVGSRSVGAYNWVHIASPETLLWEDWAAITEGELKADIAANYLGMRVLAVPGVVSWRPVATLLNTLGIEKVLFAYDADQHFNPNVAKAAGQAKDDLHKNNIQVVDLLWPTVIKQGKPWPKGIDDACLELSRKFKTVTETSYPNGIKVTRTVTQIETVKVSSSNQHRLDWWLRKRFA